MGKSVAGMRESLRQSIVNLKSSSQKICEEVSKVNDVSEKIREQCMDNSATTEQLAAGMQETSATTGTITQNIGDMRQGASDMVSPQIQRWIAPVLCMIQLRHR